MYKLHICEIPKPKSLNEQNKWSERVVVNAF